MLTKWNLAERDIDEDTGFDVARALSRARHVMSIEFGNNRLSSGAIMRAVKAALELKSLLTLEITHYLRLQIEADATQSVVDLQLKLLAVEYGGGFMVAPLERLICVEVHRLPASQKGR